MTGRDRKAAQERGVSLNTLVVGLCREGYENLIPLNGPMRFTKRPES